MSKREKLFDGITEIRDDLVLRAAKTPLKRKRKWYIPAIAAGLALVIALWPGAGTVHAAYALRTAEYPNMADYPQSDSELAYNAWKKDLQAQKREGYEGDLTSFLETAIPAFLAGEGENRICSPLNLYMALAMLAESAAEPGRQQLLELLGADDLTALRGTADDLWNAHYRTDGLITSILAGSVWLDQDMAYDDAILDTLADRYHASSFRGQMGDPDYTAALQSWLNEQTGGLLKEQAQSIGLTSDNVLALAATVYFKAPWRDKFGKSMTTQDVFYSPTGEVTADFMHSSRTGNYYWSEKFGAVSLGLESGAMWLLLPDEGYSPEQLLTDPATTDFLLGTAGRESSKHLIIDLALPRFDAVSQTDLIPILQDLGITQVFEPYRENFDLVRGQAWLTMARHDARVIVDEEGVEAAAITVMAANTGAAAPPEERIEFTLDRPFLFAITSSDGLPLFVGVVNRP